VTRLRDVQMHAIVYSPDVNGGPGKAKLELDPDMLNLVWQQNFNGPGRAAFACARYNPKLALIDWMIDHLALYREDSRGTKQVFAGKLVKPQYSGADALVYAWDYLAFLQRSRTGFRTEYPNKKIGTEIVAPEWAAAKAVSNSPFAFVATGTIQDPLALDDMTEITTNEEFGVVDFARLFTFFSLAEMAMANTAHTVKFEITREPPHTFNFWKDYGGDVTKYAFSHPGNLVSYTHDAGFDEYRNDLASVVMDDDGEQSEYVAETADVATSPYRRLQDAVQIRTLMGSTGATEADQGKAALERMLQEAVRVPRLVLLQPRQAELTPFDGWDLGDNIRATIQKSDRSGDEYDGYLKISSVGAAWSPQHGELLQIYGRQPEAT
jgi:hypothetical protein